MNRIEDWDSLVINRRKPYTYRAFHQGTMYRICLHRFEECDEHEAFYHPHPWPGAFKILKGSYKMQIGYSKDRFSKPDEVTTIILNEGSSYEMLNPLTWHRIIPLGKECYTVMVNDAPWSPDVAHTDVRTTKGKDLAKMSTYELNEHFNAFRELLKPHDHRYLSMAVNKPTANNSSGFTLLELIVAIASALLVLYVLNALGVFKLIGWIIKVIIYTILAIFVGFVARRWWIAKQKP
ncbi:type II secretion system protein [Acinetobacter sp.]|uniref:type II secretion system protein n=1 Tax=Acinetobacter sp. TaxID=472 RepID=UPI0037500A09